MRKEEEEVEEENEEQEWFPVKLVEVVKSYLSINQTLTSIIYSCE